MWSKKKEMKINYLKLSDKKIGFNVGNILADIIPLRRRPMPGIRVLNSLKQKASKS
ncbi:hypothetical protein JCM21738_5458 [Mesobacillus boroniphilus JCM 21738]|uniref:Uncharacterized protein n=1 Tax=Mesobacillus boroniphilus JCM 21738 TaxID=1294265 RepID=W4RXF8_9BACI|nr:hypothetical protein JCM21738_5458 [Mesobacillus boroniphilus JCM 21738]